MWSRTTARRGSVRPSRPASSISTTARTVGTRGILMQGKTRSRRGTGHLYQKDDRWYGQWYVRGKRVKRSLGPVRQPGADDGLTKRQAQARMLEAHGRDGLRASARDGAADGRGGRQEA